jgi:transposase
MRFNGCETEVLQWHLDHLAEDCPPEAGKRDIQIMDNASWHKVKTLRWHHFEALYLPAYSPDFNPIERLWTYLKERFLSDFYTRDAEELENKIAESLRRLIRMRERITPVTADW